MKKLLCIAAASIAAAFFAGEANALPASALQFAKPAPAGAKVRHRRRGRSGFSNWCAYNCYAVPPCSHRCYGRYGYSQFAYDEDLPFRYRYDRDASPIDNGDAFLYRFTGQPFIRAFERVY